MADETNAYLEFRDSLEATAVLSEGYKRTLRLMVHKAAEQAYERGRTEGREQAERLAGKAALHPNEERFLVEAGELDNETLEMRIESLGYTLSNMLDGERVLALQSEMRQLAAALLIRSRRSGVFGSDAL